MKCVLSLPRSVSAILAAGTLVGLVAVTHPDGLAAAYRDVRDLSALQQTISGAEGWNAALNRRSQVVAERIAIKEGLIQQVTDGRIELAVVIDRFRDLNEGDAVTMSALRARFGDLPTDELATRNVWDYLKRHEREMPSGRLPDLLRECEGRWDRRASAR